MEWTLRRKGCAKRDGMWRNRNRDIAQITVLVLPLGKWETVVVKAHSLDVSTISLYDGVNSTDV